MLFIVDPRRRPTRHFSLFSPPSDSRVDRPNGLGHLFPSFSSTIACKVARPFLTTITPNKTRFSNANPCKAHLLLSRLSTMRVLYVCFYTTGGCFPQNSGGVLFNVQVDTQQSNAATKPSPHFAPPNAVMVRGRSAYPRPLSFFSTSHRASWHGFVSWCLVFDEDRRSPSSDSHHPRVKALTVQIPQPRSSPG